MEVFINHAFFKLFGVMPIFNHAGQLWKSLLNVCYSLCAISFIALQQYTIYMIQLEQDFSGWFISATVLSTSFVILVQALATGKGIQRLMVELMEIDYLLDGTKHPKRYFSATFYGLYSVGMSRAIFRTMLMIYLGLRAPGIALQLFVPSIVVLARLNLQIYLMEIIASQLDAIATELSIALEDEDRYTVDEPNATHQCRCLLQRTEYLFGRLQKCLQMVNTLFGWSTAAIVVLVFIGITFQFRVPMHPMPFYAQVIEVVYSIIALFCLCRSSSLANEKVNEIKRILLGPFYNASLWDQINNFIVRTKLQPFEFTANGLYAINYGLFGSTLAASATYIVIMLQFDQKTLDV
ncbi:uncharacterized protein LOC128710010 [Anopheles marshallii]|uniref:uncharacterized protein LOC128710010 n=1 Tax=Anopheles marshallii TaxID=1521116 RepID=UPI00237B294B|nr:uncharacterized protein LOC128710010 [Anopheles marshallii]